MGRAGIRMNNVDVARATELGVMVVNAPVSNILSAAEQTMALLLAQPRDVPQAHQALTGASGSARSGRGWSCTARPSASWDSARSARSSPSGPRLRDETGRLRPVHLRRARPAHGRRADGLRLAARRERLHHDPPAREHRDGGPVRRGEPRQDQPGVRVVNVARGRIIVEADLAKAIRSATSPARRSTSSKRSRRPSRPCSSCPRSSSCPTSGRPRWRPTDKAASPSPSRSNWPSRATSCLAVNVSAGEVSNWVRPYMGLAELLGRFHRRPARRQARPTSKWTTRA